MYDDEEIFKLCGESKENKAKLRRNIACPSGSASCDNIQKLLWKDKQHKLSQQRIDLLLADANVFAHPLDSNLSRMEMHLNLSTTEDNRSEVSICTVLSQESFASAVSTPDLSGRKVVISNNECEVNSVTPDNSAIKVVKDINQKIITDTGDCNASSSSKSDADSWEAVERRQQFIKEGSEIVVNKSESRTMATGSKNSNPKACRVQNDGESEEEDWKSFLLKIKVDLQKSVKESQKALEDKVDEGLKKIEDSNNKWHEEFKITEQRSKENEKELQTAKVELESCKDKLRKVIDISIRQEQVIHECKDKIDYLENMILNDVIRITGIRERKEEDVIQVVHNFFKQKLKIQKELSVIDAFRIGKGSHRAIKVQLAKPREKALIFGNLKHLKGVVNDIEKPYQVREHLSAKKYTEKKRQRQLMFENNKKSTAEKLMMSFENSKLKVNGKIYEKMVSTPTSHQLLKPETEMLADAMAIQVDSGDVIEVDGQKFTGFTAEVRSIEEVQSVYYKVCAGNNSARHIMMAYRLPGRNFHTLQDFQDNDEHGGGEFMLKLMKDAQIENRVLFVVRDYDGTHIGTKRFDAMKDAMTSVVARVPFNSILQKHQFPWPARNQRYIRGGEPQTEETDQ